MPWCTRSSSIALVPNGEAVYGARYSTYRRQRRLPVRIQRSEPLLQQLDAREIGSYIVVSAPLVRRKSKTANGKATACPGAAEVNDGGEVVFLSEGRLPSLADRLRDVSIEEGGGHLDRMTRNNASVQAVEPTGG